MLTELFRTLLQIVQVIGTLAFLSGVFFAIGAAGTGQGPIGWTKGVVLMLLGAYLLGFVRSA